MIDDVGGRNVIDADFNRSGVFGGCIYCLCISQSKEFGCFVFVNYQCLSGIPCSVSSHEVCDDKRCSACGRISHIGGDFDVIRELASIV